MKRVHRDAVEDAQQSVKCWNSISRRSWGLLEEDGWEGAP